MTTPITAYLAVYLKDHFAGATAGASLAGRIADAHLDDPDAAALRQLAKDVTEDRALLAEILGSLGIEPSKTMDALAEAGEHLGRLKPNGQLTGRSPLSDLVEFELMRLGVEGKLSCWMALRILADTDPRLSAEALDALVARAQSQLALLETCWLNAVPEAFLGAEPDKASA
jgi:hypothetical protein